MFKNALMYASITLLATTTYTFHIDADIMLLSDPDFDWVTKAVRAFGDIPRLSFLGMFPCVGGFESSEKLGRFRPLDKTLCNSNRCPSHLYIDSWESHWSLRSYVVDNSRFASMWPFPADVHAYHIEALFVMALLLKGRENASLPTATAWMSLEDFRVCRCFAAPSCHRWQSPPDYREDAEPYVKLSSAIFATLTRTSHLWDYYTGRVPRGSGQLYYPMFEMVVLLVALSCVIVYGIAYLRKMFPNRTSTAILDTFRNVAGS